jgi:hypothetical protein
MDLNAKKINESLEKSEATELKPWYRTNKYGLLVPINVCVMV